MIVFFFHFRLTSIENNTPIQERTENDPQIHERTVKVLQHQEIFTAKTETLRKWTKLPTQRETTAKPTENFQREITKECQPKFDPSNIKTPFKFFIYDLLPMYNKDIVTCKNGNDGSCYSLDFCGQGGELYRFHGDRLTFATAEALAYSQFLRSKMQNQTRQTKDQTPKVINSVLPHSLSIRNTHMFSLEVIMHYKLLHSPYRTLDPEKADMFYIPFYSGLMCECDRKKSPELVNEFINYLKTLKYYWTGKPHFSTLGKIQREQTSESCPILRQRESSNITFIAIEKESHPAWNNNIPYVFGKSIVVAPYPAYVHFINEKPTSMLSSFTTAQHQSKTQFDLSVPNLADRNVFLFLGCGSRRSNSFRSQIIDQFAVQTREDYGTYLHKQNVTKVEQIMLITQECSTDHRYTTTPWMMHSIFCLQPPGDSPTRKSFYDAILSSCIPVIFKLKDPYELPFSDVLNYDEFTFTIDEKLISRYNKTVIEIVRSIPQEKVKFLHQNVLRVAKWFQYSMPDGGPQYDEDAVTLILQQLKKRYKL